LHAEVQGRLDSIERVTIETQEAGARIIDKTGPLNNYADRDHCIQYMVAVTLIFGELTAQSYSDETASDPRIDALRDKMEVRENERFTTDYFDPARRGIGNAVQVFYRNGTSSERIEVSYPIGHRRRRDEGIPLLVEKFHSAIGGHYPASQAARIELSCGKQHPLESIAVTDFVAELVV
jgi:2-methylcitrate dehydratase